MLGDRIEWTEDLGRRDRQYPCRGRSDSRLEAGLAHWGSLISASLTIFSQREMSLPMSRPNSAGVPPTGKAPIFSSESRIFGAARTLLMAALSCEVISAGVPRFAANHIQPAVTSSGKPASTTEGTSLRAEIRAGAVTASARNLPVAIRSITGSVVTNMY